MPSASDMDAQAQLIVEAGQTLGPKAIITDRAEIEPWLTDWRGRVHGSAPAILAPATTDEVADIVKLAAKHGVPLVPQGGNTGMAAGATPPADGSALILSLRRMNNIRSLSAENRARRGRSRRDPRASSTGQRTKPGCVFR